MFGIHAMSGQRYKFLWEGTYRTVDQTFFPFLLSFLLFPFSPLVVLSADVISSEDVIVRVRDKYPSFLLFVRFLFAFCSTHALALF